MVVPAVRSARLLKLTALMTEPSERNRLCLSPSLVQVGIFAPSNFIFVINEAGLHTGAAEVQGHLFCSLCCGGCQRWHGGRALGWG